MSRPVTSPTPTASTSSPKPARSSSFFAFRSRPSTADSPPPKKLHRISMSNRHTPPQQHPQPQRTVSQTQPRSAQPQNTPPQDTPPPPPQKQQPPPPPQPQQSHDQEPSSTHEAPLHPEIRSTVSLTMAHTQKIYFSGPLVHKLDRTPDGHGPHKGGGWRDVWAQLYGTTLSIWDMGEVKIASQQGKEVPPSYINITEAVRSTFHLFYLCDSTEPPSPVRPCPRCSNAACDGDITPSQIHQRHHSQHCWNESAPFLLPLRPGSHVMGYCLPTLLLGESAPRGDIYGPPHSRYLKRRQEYPFYPYSW